jgi:predicted transcriptional regulator
LIDIIGHILEVVNSADDNGLTKTKIMYGVFLSYAQLKDYLSILLEKGLMVEEYRKEQKEEKEKEKEKQRTSYYYRITYKGRHFLQKYRCLSEMIA